MGADPFRRPDSKACRLPHLTDATGTLATVVPAEGRLVDLPAELQRLDVHGDVEVVCDPVVVDVQVEGLQEPSSWHFALRIGAAGGTCNDAAVELEQGRGRMLVPRGVPLRADLLVQRYRSNGALRLPRPAVLQRFDATFTVPANGEPPTVVLAAPPDLAQQLAVLDPTEGGSAPTSHGR